MGAIEIKVNGRPALTTAQLAAEFDLDPATARKALSRISLDPVEHLDARTPLYDAEAARAGLRDRPGRGAPGKSRTRVQEVVDV